MEDIKYLIKNNEGECWAFTNLCKVAKFLDTQQNYVKLCMNNNKPCKGWKILIADDENIHDINDEFTYDDTLPITYKINPTYDFAVLYKTFKHFFIDHYQRLCHKIMDKLKEIIIENGVDQDTANEYVLSNFDKSYSIIDYITGFDMDKIRDKYYSSILNNIKDDKNDVLGFGIDSYDEFTNVEIQDNNN